MERCRIVASVIERAIQPNGSQLRHAISFRCPSTCAIYVRFDRPEAAARADSSQEDGTGMPQWNRTNGRVRPSSRSTASRSAAQAVHEFLREEIVSMHRLPGDVISEKDLSASHHVSRTPVREALLRLADEQLVEIAPKSGTIVARIPLAILPEIIIARSALERVIVADATARADGEDIAHLREVIERQREAVAAGDRDRFHAEDEALHRGIAEAAGHLAIWAMIEQIKVQLDRYRRLTLPQPRRMEHSLGEHVAVVDAIAARDASAAMSAMTVHLDGLSSSLAAVRDLNPDYFDDDVDRATADWPRIEGD